MRVKKVGTSLVLLIISCIILTFSTAAETIYSARTIALGGVTGTSLGVAFNDDLGRNPAAIAVTKGGIHYHSDNGFASKPGYESQAINLSFKKGSTGWALAWNKFGTALLEENNGETVENYWGEQSFGCGFAKAFGKFNAGLALWDNKHRLDINDDEILSGNDRDQQIDFGLLWDGKMFGVGFVAKNISKQSKFEPVYTLGLRWGQLDSFAALLDTTLTKDALGDNKVFFNGGIECWFLPNLALRIGLDQAGMFTSGIGIINKRLQVDYSYQTHHLGNGHYLSCGVIF